ncbi:MAG: phosphotransferase family protein [Candidatus Eremiobacteraeota bacterium]|nr:phosphotransferase family protein [Candidatus Eremiobacteraeota bacterium]
MLDETIEVRAEERLDLARLEPYLRAHLPGAGGALSVRQFGGGHANLTYLLRFGSREFVLRRPPLGPVAPGSHDMRREHRVLSAIANGFPLAPRSLLLCTDPGIIGADFFVMERRHGIAFRRDVASPWRDRTDVLRRTGDALVDTLAALHAIDPAAVGLADLGRPEGYVQRQFDGWLQRWYAALTPDIAPAEDLTGWLRQRVPPQRRTALVHNDYKLDNLLLDAEDPGRVVAVLDWDMCTRGEPLMDLGYLLALWAQPGEVREPQESWMPTWRPGFPSRREAAQRYAGRTGADLSQLHWYVVFSAFRFAVILQQIYVRYVRGQTHDERFRTMNRAVEAMIDRGTSLIGTDEFA